MAQSFLGWLKVASTIVVVIAMWSPEVSSSTCGKVDFLNGLINEQMENDTHQAEVMHEFVTASSYGCIEVCKGTNGCTIVNYGINATTCVLYSTTGTLTFEESAGDWVLIEMQDITFNFNQAICDPTNCAFGQYCRTFSSKPVCLSYA